MGGEILRKTPSYFAPRETVPTCHVLPFSSTCCNNYTESRSGLTTQRTQHNYYDKQGLHARTKTEYLDPQSNYFRNIWTIYPTLKLA